MSEAAERATAAVLELPVAERLDVLDAILASLPGPTGALAMGTPEFDAELDRRRAEHESGSDPGVSAEDFFRELREKRP